MAVVFATNEETLLVAKQLGAKHATLSLDVALNESFLADRPRRFVEHAGPVRLLWTGRMMPRKALALTLDGLREAKADVVLTVIGEGYPPEVVREMIASRGLEKKVEWSGGAVPWSEMREAYKTHDAFLFTSLRDSCGSQLLEAMALGLPIITLDHQGARLLVPTAAGYKVPVTGKEETVRAIGRAIDAFAATSSAERDAMSAAGWNAARSLTFGIRAERAEALYGRILDAGKRKSSRSESGQVRLSGVTPI